MHIFLCFSLSNRHIVSALPMMAAKSQCEAATTPLQGAGFFGDSCNVHEIREIIFHYCYLSTRNIDFLLTYASEEHFQKRLGNLSKVDISLIRDINVSLGSVYDLTCLLKFSSLMKLLLGQAWHELVWQSIKKGKFKKHLLTRWDDELISIRFEKSGWYSSKGLVFNAYLRFQSMHSSCCIKNMLSHEAACFCETYKLTSPQCHSISFDATSVGAHHTGFHYFNTFRITPWYVKTPMEKVRRGDRTIQAHIFCVIRCIDPLYRNTRESENLAVAIAFKGG